MELLEPVQYQNLGAFAANAANRAFRSNSSDLLMQILWDFRYNPLRGGSLKPGPGIATGNSRGAAVLGVLRVLK
jgi:hypothetical protein